MEMMNETQVAKLLGCTKKALQAQRYQGRGPRFVRFSSRCVRYRMEDLEEYIAARVVETTDSGKQV